MLDTLLELGLFTAKSFIIVVVILLLIAGILGLLSRGKQKNSGKISIKNLNDHYQNIKEHVLQETLLKKDFKKWLKTNKAEKKASSHDSKKKNIYVIRFNGDIKASAVESLREEITAILNVANDKDEVVVCLESAGGMVHAYGLGAAQLMRIRQRNIPLTIIVDKVAASGGYMMAELLVVVLSGMDTTLTNSGVSI